MSVSISQAAFPGGYRGEPTLGSVKDAASASIRFLKPRVYQVLRMGGGRVRNIWSRLLRRIPAVMILPVLLHTEVGKELLVLARKIRPCKMLVLLPLLDLLEVLLVLEYYRQSIYPVSLIPLCHLE